MNLLNVSSDGMMAYLQIPKIDVKLPIYHSTNNGVLQKGVGHMEGSSLPIVEQVRMLFYLGIEDYQIQSCLQILTR